MRQGSGAFALRNAFLQPPGNADAMQRLSMLRFLKPVDKELILSRKETHVITLEDNVLTGGLGDAVARVLRGKEKVVRSFGYPDIFLPHGQAAALFEEFGPNFREVLSYLIDCHARG